MKVKCFLMCTQGAKGDQGEKGVIGPKGNIGMMGEIGPKGEEGSMGDNGTVGPTGPTGTDGPKGPNVRLLLIYDLVCFAPTEQLSIHVFMCIHSVHYSDLYTCICTSVAIHCNAHVYLLFTKTLFVL